MKYQFTVIIEKDESGFYVAEVPELKSCYTQGKTLEEVLERIKEVIELCMEEQGLPFAQRRFVGVHQLEVEVRDASLRTCKA